MTDGQSAAGARASSLGAARPAARGARSSADASHRETPCRDQRGHGLLIEPDGSVQIWHDGRVRTTARCSASVPQGSLPPYTLAKVPGLTGVVAAAAGGACSFAVRADGTLLAWGINGGNGKLGTTPLSFFEERAFWGPDSNVPVPLAVRFDAIDVSSMNDHALALTRDGRVYAWGTGDKGQLGIGPMPVIKFRHRSPSAYPYTPFPVEIAGLSGVIAISAGYAHSLAVMKDGTVRAWGENRWGEVGDGTTAVRNAPVVVPGVKDAVGVAAGSGFSAAVLARRDGDDLGQPDSRRARAHAGQRQPRRSGAGARAWRQRRAENRGRTHSRDRAHRGRHHHLLGRAGCDSAGVARRTWLRPSSRDSPASSRSPRTRTRRWPCSRADGS